MSEETKKAPFVRIAGDGCDVMILISDTDDIDIAHQAIDIAFKRYKRVNELTVGRPHNEPED